MKVQVYRTSASSYQNSKFLTNEQRALEEINGVKYIRSLKEIDESIPFILISNTHTKPEELSKLVLENTELLIHPNSGHDNISSKFIEDSKFPIIIGNPIRANAVAEYTLSCLFHHFTPMQNHLHWSQDRTWDRKLLRDQKVIIIGHGHIGSLLTSSLSPLCREVKVLDPNKEGDQAISSWDESIFDGVNILILAADLNKSSHSMINYSILKRLSSHCLIINPARGELIKEAELVEFLQKNPKAYAFLDVFENEPFGPGYLHDLENINKTSHIAGVFERLNNDIISFEYLIIKDFVRHLEQQSIDQFISDYSDCLLNTEKNKLTIVG